MKKKNQMIRKRKHRFFCFLLCCSTIVICFFTVLYFKYIKSESKPVVISNKQTPSAINKKNAWYLILVNQVNAIPDTYPIELVKLDNGERVDKRIFESLQKMFNDARAQGVYPIVVSGYRNSQEQQTVLKEKILAYEREGYSKEDAEEKALEWVARPGYSEHQLGISVDINADLSHSTDEKVYEWLTKNGHNYGFIHRYPSNKVHITGVINEPWHYRFVGEKVAKEMFESGKCLEEYLETLK